MLLFVGERRSNKAKQMRVHWEDGALAAKPLFEALRLIGIDPATCRFVNWFEGGKREVRTATVPVVAMGNKVQAALAAEGIAFIALVHPAARGKIRRTDLYRAHVKERLAQCQTP
jgi:hypothetical protein